MRITLNGNYENWLICNDNYKLQYSSNIILLKWVPPQCIVPWIIFAILKDNYYDIEHYVILCLPVLLYSSFSFIGIVFFLLILTIEYIIKKVASPHVQIALQSHSPRKLNLVVYRKICDFFYTIRNGNFKVFLKKVFSPSNIALTLTLGIIFIIYFSGNILEPKPQLLKPQLVKYSGNNIFIYICFILSFLPYTIILFKDNKKNSLYWASTVILLILPFLKMGLHNDLCMRVSIMPLFVYNMLAIELLFTQKSKIIKGVLIIILIIGSVSPIKELYSSVKSLSTRFVVGDKWYTLLFQANKNSKANVDEKYNYFTYELDKSIFYNYLARKKL